MCRKSFIGNKQSEQTSASFSCWLIIIWMEPGAFRKAFFVHCVFLIPARQRQAHCLSPCNARNEMENDCMKTVNLELQDSHNKKNVSQGVISKTFTGLNFCSVYQAAPPKKRGK